MTGMAGRATTKRPSRGSIPESRSSKITQVGHVNCYAGWVTGKMSPMLLISLALTIIAKGGTSREIQKPVPNAGRKLILSHMMNGQQETVTGMNLSWAVIPQNLSV
jgi:hypothetical protein